MQSTLELVSNSGLAEIRQGADANICEEFDFSPLVAKEALLKALTHRESVLRWCHAWCRNQERGMDICFVLDTDVIVDYLECWDPVAEGRTAEVWFFEESSLPFWIPLGTLRELRDYLDSLGKKFPAVFRAARPTAEGRAEKFGLIRKLRKLRRLTPRMDYLSSVLRTPRYLGILSSYDASFADGIAKLLAQQQDRADTTTNNTRDAINLAATWEIVKSAAVGSITHERSSKSKARTALLLSGTHALHNLDLDALEEEVEVCRYRFQLGEVPERKNWLVEWPNDTWIRHLVDSPTGTVGTMRAKLDVLLSKISTLRDILRTQRNYEEFLDQNASSWRSGKAFRKLILTENAAQMQEQIRSILTDKVLHNLDFTLSRRIPSSRPSVQSATGGSSFPSVATVRRSLHQLYFLLEEGLWKYESIGTDKPRRAHLQENTKLTWQEDSSGVSAPFRRWSLRTSRHKAESLDLLHLVQSPLGTYMVSWSAAGRFEPLLEAFSVFSQPTSLGTPEGCLELEIPLSLASRYLDEGLVMNLGGSFVGSPIPRQLTLQNINSIAQAAHNHLLKLNAGFAFEFCKDKEPPIRDLRICTRLGDFGTDLSCRGDEKTPVSYVMSHCNIASHVACFFRLSADAIYWECELTHSLAERIEEITDGRYSATPAP